MKINKLFCAILAVAVLSPNANGLSAKKKERSETKKENIQKTPYQKLLDKPSRNTAKGNFLTLHKLDSKIYVEMPVKYLGRDILLASTIAETASLAYSWATKTPTHCTSDSAEWTALLSSKLSTLSLKVKKSSKRR